MADPGDTPRLTAVTDALLKALADATGRLWGDGVAPGAENATPAYPYGVVYSIAGGSTGGDAGNPDGTAVQAFQLTSVGRTRLEAEHLAARARGVVLDRDGSGFAHPIDAYTRKEAPSGAPVARSLAADDGLKVWHRRFYDTSGHMREGTVSNVSDRFYLHVAPA